MQKIIPYLLSLWFLVMLMGNLPQGGEQQLKTYLALGDSYTIGESVAEEMRWPNQLARILNQSGLPLEYPHIVAQTGWTTDELLVAIESAGIKKHYDYVSLLIGVNNQYRARSVDSFVPEFTTLLERAIAISKNKPEGVFVLSIPDWGVMPFAQGRDSTKIATEIAAYNAAIKAICKRYEVAFFDITPISREALDNATYVASDQLHPSAAMYGAWVDKVLPFFKTAQND
ncbi:MAG: SGNH/GDSL hydrolase family protein [Bacteroidetes bacterium]|nr:SGNH/GDSL hydrolase family protein [Bacteroidota bacterium]